MEDLSGDIDRVAITVKGQPSRETVERVAGSTFPNLRQITRSRRAPKWHGGVEGLCQIVALALLQEKVVHDSIYQA